MNKQQLAAKIWESANQMRSKIEANEYKDYILGFIFYKYLSDKELQFTRKEDFSEEEIKALSEEDAERLHISKVTLAISSAIKIFFQPGLKWVRISMSPMFAMHCLLLAG